MDLSPDLSLLEAIIIVLRKVSLDHPVDQNPQNYDIYVAKKNG